MAAVTSFPIISIVGPTATGKTDTALALAQHYLQSGLVDAVDIISADSRQVYQGMEILTGADIPTGFVPVDQLTTSIQTAKPVSLSYPYFSNSEGTVRLHGVSIITPSQEWSVALFHQLVMEVIDASDMDRRLMMLVGGTGLYHSYALELKPGQTVPPDETWRTKAEEMSIDELRQTLQQMNPDRLATMNQSDLSNPRRLIRAIEVARAVPGELQGFEGQAESSSLESASNLSSRPSHLYIGLDRPFPEIEQRIKQRVVQRWDAGARSEVEHLISLDPSATKTALSATGVKEIQSFLNGEAEKDQALEHWFIRERQYAKRQLTWFKKQPSITWFLPEKTNSIITHLQPFCL